MATVSEEINVISNRMVELQAVIADDEKQANALEAQARELRRNREAKKLELQGLNTALNQKRVVVAVETEIQGAQAARAEADKHLAEMAASNVAAKSAAAKLEASLAELEKQKAELAALIKKAEETKPAE